MIMLIDTYSNFLHGVAEIADCLLDDLALNPDALQELQDTYTPEQIEEYNRQLKLIEMFERMEEADRQDALEGRVPCSSELSDNFWNE